MSAHLITAEARTRRGCVRAHIYGDDYPAEQVRRPTRHVLAMFAGRAPANACGRFLNHRHAERMIRFGQMIFVPAGVGVFGSGPGGAHRMLSYQVDPDASETFRRIEGAWDERDLDRFGDIRCERLAATMRRLGLEIANPGFASDLLIEGMTAMLEVDLIRHLRRDTPLKPQTSARGGLSPYQLRIVDDHIRSWSGDTLTAESLARLVGLSRGHFMRAFRQSTGHTVHDHVERLRIDRAKHLLAQADVPLKQIASQLGFATPSSFSLAFRRATAMTPAGYRRARA